MAGSTCCAAAGATEHDPTSRSQCQAAERQPAASRLAGSIMFETHSHPVGFMQERRAGRKAG